MDRDTLLALHAMLDTITPLRTDCGAYCGAACCAPDEDGQGGVHLFPGEDALYGDIDWAHIAPSGWVVDGADVPMLVCRGTCPRDMRPLGCRIFPLAPKAQPGGFGAQMDRRAYAMCPLAGHGVAGLSQDFVRGVIEAFAEIERAGAGGFLRAWEALMKDYLWGL